MKLTGPDSGKSVFPVRATGSTGDSPLKKVLFSGNPNPAVKQPLLSGGRGTEIPLLGDRPGPVMPQAEASGQPDGHSEILTQLARSLNLPTDDLSSALINFVRYFSLPLDPALLFKLRREVLSLKIPRESAALAAAAAADKGVELTPDALERYAAAIDPDAGRKQGGMDSPGSESGQKQGDSPAEDTSQKHGDLPKDDTGCVSPSRVVDIEGLNKICFDIEENNPLLSVLNKIPGANGERWMVYPFQVSSGGKRMRVSVRVMAGQGKDAVRLAVDVAGGDRRWLFVMSSSPKQRKGAEAGSSGNRLPEVRVSLWPPLPRREEKAMEREIREALGPLVNRVILRDCESFLSDSKNEVLPSVNEEV